MNNVEVTQKPVSIYKTILSNKNPSTPKIPNIILFLLCFALNASPPNLLVSLLEFTYPIIYHSIS